MKALDLYTLAERKVRESGFSWEIEWQKERLLKEFEEQDLLRESAWVILCSGFKEASVRKSFDYVSLCFFDWSSSAEIVERKDICMRTAFSGFRNVKKITAVAEVACLVHSVGFKKIREQILSDPIYTLQSLPYIGPVTSWHLAKNLGIDVAKNDRHLARIASQCGYENAHSLCDEISEITGHPVSVVDIIFWRFAAMFPNYFAAA